jgi:Protein of unknown function (DUF962)
MALLAWQWSLYRDNHRDRANLALHAITNPLFLAGTMALPLALATRWWLAPLGAIAMIVAIAVQGRGHARETVAPVPFRGPLDVVARIVAEQWITFPRYVVTGGFARAWRGHETSTGSTRTATGPS